MIKIIKQPSGGEIDCKRFYLENAEITYTCPKCGKVHKYEQYLSYPILDKKEAISLYCWDCDYDWTEDIIVSVLLKNPNEENPINNRKKYLFFSMTPYEEGGGINDFVFGFDTIEEYTKNMEELDLYGADNQIFNAETFDKFYVYTRDEELLKEEVAKYLKDSNYKSNLRE